MADTTDTGFWSRFWAHLTGRTRLERGQQAYPFNTASTPGGTIVSTDSALKLSAVWACVRLRSQTMASLPLHLRDDKLGFARSHPLYRILHDEPNADMCAAEFWEAMFASMDISGNAYAEIKRSGKGAVVSLEYLNPEDMIVQRTDSGAIAYLYRDGSTNRREFEENDILHLRGFTLDGLVGLSPLRYAAETLGGQLEANNAALNEYKNRLKAGGFLEYEKGILQEEQRSKFRAMLASFGSPENAGKYMILENGVKVSSNNLKLSPADAQLLESRLFGIEEICRAFGVPPQLIGQTDKASSWASSLDSTNMGFLTYSLRPMLVKVEQTVSRKLLSPADRRIYSPKFSVEALLRTDPASRAAYYATMLQNGVYSRNYVRALEDLPPADGGDELTVQLNMTTINQIGELNKVGKT